MPDLRPEPVRVRVPQVHAQDLAGEQGRLLPARSGPDLHDHVPLVVRVARQEEHLERLDLPFLVGLETLNLIAGQRAQLLVGLGVAQLTGAGQPVPGVLQLPERSDNRFQLGELLAEAPQRVGVGHDFGLRQFLVERVVLSRDVEELGVDHDPAAGGCTWTLAGC
jgi:hypothetical protein